MNERPRNEGNATEEEQPVHNEIPEPMTPGGKRFLRLWAAGVLLLYLVGGYLGVRTLRGYAAEDRRIQQARLESVTSGPKVLLPSPPPGERPVDVAAGVYLNRISELAIKESAWTADFNLWFRWSGDTLSPGEDFRVVNGQVQLREKLESSASGAERYEEYRVIARMMKEFDPSCFPFGYVGLLVEVEDAAHGVETLRYVADECNSGVAAEAMMRSVKLIRSMVGVTTRSSRAGLAQPGKPDGSRRVHPQLFFAILGMPAGFSIYLRLFQALFASVAVALITLYIKPIHIDCRFGLPVGGFFAAVANNVFVATLLPVADRLTLSDMVNRASLLTIFLVLVQSVISLYIFDTMGRERLARIFDRVSFALLLAGYVAVNLALPLAARP